MEVEDPFQGILNRSSVAQALRDARASLARPSRPFTPADRSLFRQASNTDCSRPSSSYSIGQLRFEKDMFAVPSESTVSTRSTLRSRSSDLGGTCGELCAAIPEELEEPELCLADVGVFGDSGEFIAEYHPPSHRPSSGKIPVVRCREVEWACEAEHGNGEEGSAGDEYDVGAAEDLALRMDVPSTASDEDSDDGETNTVASIGESKPRAPGQPRGVVRPARKKSWKGNERGDAKVKNQGAQALQQASTTDWQGSLEGRLTELEAAKPSELAAIEIESLVAVLQGHANGQELQAVPRLLRATLRLMDRQEADAPCLLRLGRCALELLGLMVAAGEDAGSDGVQAAYLNIAKALFKLSKDATHDKLFKSVGLLDALLVLLASPDLHCKSADLRIFAIGILKNVTNNDDNLKHITKQGVLPILHALMKPENLSGSSREAQQLVQITALLRNLAASSKRNQQLVDLGLLADLTRISGQYGTDQELQTNIARVLAKLSLHDAPCEAFEADASHLRQVLHSINAHADVPSIVLRLSFVLGNLTARSDCLREMFWSECGGASSLPSLVQRYWQKDRKLAQTDVESAARGTDVVECEGVLVKLVRLAANVAISRSVGIEVSASSAIVDPLLDILGCKRMAESEELVLNSMAATTNLLFYDEPTNLLFSNENKELLCRLLRPLLLESYNVEALMEAARALGNLSRHQDARQWIGELRIDEILAILMAHNDRDLVFYACGTLVNIAGDVQHGTRLCCQGGLRMKLATLLSDAPADDAELQLVAIKVLSNLRLSGDAEAAWAEGELAAMHSGLARVQRELEKRAGKECDLDASVSAGLAELTANLRESLPLCLEPVEAARQGKGMGKGAGYSEKSLQALGIFSDQVEHLPVDPNWSVGVC